jgi:hypothetical protein
MKEQKETQLAKTETKPAAVNTPFGFMRRFRKHFEMFNAKSARCANLPTSPMTLRNVPR